jgi:hypothetical protein
MPLTNDPGYVLRSRVQTGDKVRALKDATGNQVQLIALSDENGDQSGVPLNPFTVEANTLPLPTGAATQATLAALLTAVGTESTLLNLLFELSIDRLAITITEVVSPTLTYTGRALSGSLTSDTAWSISQTTVAGNITTVLRADGGAFSQIWDDRATLTYA